MVNNKFLHIFLLVSILINFTLATYNSYFFEINVFGDRDLVRASEIYINFQVYGYEFGYQGGRRIPGGFYYYYLALLDIFTKNIIIKNYISFFFSIISFIFLFKLNKNIFNKLDLKLSLLFFLSSTCFLQQTTIFWNPSLGLPFLIIGIAFFINFFENKKKITLFLSYVLIFLASQFHISYISFILIFLIISIIFRVEKIILNICLIIISFIFCYSPYLLNFFYPIVDININSYSIIQNSSYKIIEDFNIFTWFFKKQINNINVLLFKLSNLLLISISLIYLISSVLLTLIIIISLRIYKILKSRIDKNIFINNYFISTLLFFALIFTISNTNLSKLIFVVPTILLLTFVLIFTNKFLQDDQYKNQKKKFYLIFYLYILIFFINNLGYLFTYGQLTNIINGTNRFSLVILPIYALISGISISILIDLIDKFFESKKKLFSTLIIFIFLLFQITYALNFILDKNKDNTYIIQKKALDDLEKNYGLDKEDFVHKVGFLRLKESKIIPIETVGVSYYLSSKNYSKNQNKVDNCFIVIFVSNNNYEIQKIIRKIDNFLRQSRDEIKILELNKFKDYFLLKYVDKNNLCINNINNDYIFTEKEKKIENFLFKKDNQKSFKFSKKKLTEYYFNLLNKDFLLPINILLQLEVLKDEISIKIISKMLRNSSSKLNGFWDEVQFYKPKLIFKNLNSGEKIIYLINKDAIGNDIYKSPIIFSNIKLPEGNYEIILNIEKINFLFNGYKLNDISFKIDNNFILKY